MLFATCSHIFRGQNLTVDATGTIKTTVEAGAKVAIKVKLGPTTVYRKTFDLCKEIEKVGGRCPINSGKPRIVKTFTVPRGIPRVSQKPRAYEFVVISMRCLKTS